MEDGARSTGECGCEPMLLLNVLYLEKTKGTGTHTTTYLYCMALALKVSNRYAEKKHLKRYLGLASINGLIIGEHLIFIV